MYFLDDPPNFTFIDPLIVTSGLLAIAILGGGLWMRRRLRRRPRRGPAYQVFRLDAANAAILWAATQLVVVTGWALRVEGLRVPIWSYLGMLVGAAIAILAWRRERAPWPSLAKSDGVELLTDGRVQRGTSQTWEPAMLAAAGGAFVSYLATAGHAYGHPIHWLTTILTFPVGYALGLAVWSPRFKLITERAKRDTAGGPKRARPPRKRGA